MASRPSATMEFPRSSQRISTASGLASVLLVLASIAAFGVDFPTYDDTGRTFAAYYGEHAGEIELSVFLGALSIAAFIWFASLLRGLYVPSELKAGRLLHVTDIGYAAAIAGATLTLVTLATQEATVIASGTVEPGVIRALDLLGDYAFVMAGLVLGVWFLASFIVVRVTRVLPDWLAWLAAAGVLLAVLQSTLLLAPQNDDGVLGALGVLFLVVLVIWVAATSLTLMRRAERTTG